MSQKIASTNLENLKPVGAAGELMFARVCAVVEQELGAGYAAALAEPVPLRGGKGIDWYAANDETYRPYEHLGAEDKAAARTWFDGFAAAAQTRIAALETQGGEAARSRAMALRAAATLANPDTLAVRAGKVESSAPMVVVYGWGFQRMDSLKAEAVVLTETAAGPPPARRSVAPAPMASAARASETAAEVAAELSEKAGCRPSLRFVPWTISLAVAVSLGALFSLFLPACGIRLPFGIELTGLISGGACGGSDGAEATAGLLAEIARLEEALSQREASCAPPATAVQAAPDQRFETRLADDNKGEIQISLVWNTTDDLDLFALCADETIIGFKTKKACMGELDIDANVAESNLTSEPVENIVWKGKRPPAGAMRIVVGLAKRRTPGDTAIPFKLRVVKDGASQEFDGVVNRGGDRIEVHRFDA